MIVIQYIVCIITSFFVGLNIQKYFNIKLLVQNNWAQLQCTPYGSWLYPFLGPKSISLADNQAHCDAGKFDSMFGLNMLPHTQNLDFLHSITAGISKTLNEFRKKFANIEQAVFKDINNIWQRLWAIYIRIVQVFVVMFKIVEKLLALFIDVMQVLADIYCNLGSIWNSIIGDAGRYFCFDGNTLVKMYDDSLKPINKININDILKNDNKVLSVYKFSSDNVTMFKYDNVIVSGSHLVFEDNKWIRVADSKTAEKVFYNKKFIYSIQTENNTFISDKNIIFSDAEESMDFIPNKYYINKILDLLNNKIHSLDKEVHSQNNSKSRHNYNNCDYDIYLNGLYGNNKILLESGKYKKIKNIKIGDKLINGATVVGRCKRSTDNIQLYRHKNIILSGYDIVNYNNKWMPVYECPLFDKYYNKNIKYLYHVQTDINNIRIKNFEILSLVPIASNDSKDIDKCFEKYINESYKCL